MPRYEESAVVAASADEVFAFVDDHARFSAHMAQSSWMMGGSRLRVELDGGRGQAVGSHIRMRGRVLGIDLFLDEVITERDPPRHKAWRTVGDVNLLVIGHYAMRLDLTPQAAGSHIEVGIDWDLPARTPWIGRLLGKPYARWCVRQMLAGILRAFPPRETDIPLTPHAPPPA